MSVDLSIKSSAIIGKCIASRSGVSLTQLAPLNIKDFAPEEDIISSGAVQGVDNIISKIEAAFADFERMFREDMETFIFLIIPEDTGFLMRNYADNFSRLFEIKSTLPYATYVEEAVGWNWKKGSAEDQAAQKCEDHALRIYRTLLRRAFKRQGLDIEAIEESGGG